MIRRTFLKLAGLCGLAPWLKAAPAAPAAAAARPVFDSVPDPKTGEPWVVSLHDDRFAWDRALVGWGREGEPLPPVDTLAEGVGVSSRLPVYRPLVEEAGRRFNEAIALDYVIPFRVITPEWFCAGRVETTVRFGKLVAPNEVLRRAFVPFGDPLCSADNVLHVGFPEKGDVSPSFWVAFPRCVLTSLSCSYAAGRLGVWENAELLCARPPLLFDPFSRTASHFVGRYHGTRHKGGLEPHLARVHAMASPRVRQMLSGPHA